MAITLKTPAEETRPNSPPGSRSRLPHPVGEMPQVGRTGSIIGDTGGPRHPAQSPSKALNPRGADLPLIPSAPQGWKAAGITTRASLYP